MPCERAIHNLLQSWSIEGWEKQDIKFSLNEHSSALHNHSLMFKTAQNGRSRESSCTAKRVQS